jgi:hypothetical protein
MKAQYLKAYLNYLTNYANRIDVPSVDIGSTRLSYYAKRIAKILYMLEVLDTNDITKYQELAKKIVLGDPSWKKDLTKVEEVPQVIKPEDLKPGEPYNAWEKLAKEDQQPKISQEIYDILNGKKEGQ